MHSVSLESMIDEAFPKPMYSEEAYFGLNCSFSSEMIILVEKLREDLKSLLGADWKDNAKRAVIINRELETPASSSKLIKTLDNIGECISRNCNIEKCYIGLFNDINAHTIPVVFDSSVFLDHDKKPIFKKYGEFFINSSAVRDDVEIQKNLMKLEDIVINKDGYKFKDKTGKIFIINIGLPIILDEVYESTPQDICSILFHEIGHNFQQILRGSNQMMIEYYVRAHLAAIMTNKFYDIIGFIDSCLINSHIKNVIKLINKSNNARFAIIKIMLSGMILINRDGTLITREDLGEIERENLMKVINYSKVNGSIMVLSTFTRIFSSIAKTFNKLLSMTFLPLRLLHKAIVIDGLNKEYSEVIKEHKSYEQFADTFAVSYGFGGSAGKFYIEVQKYIKTMNIPTYASILNHIPIISTIDAVNQLNLKMINSNVRGYDEEYVRIAQAYRILEHEISVNKSLTSSQKKEIETHMEVIKEDFDNYKKLEMENFNTNPSIVKSLMKKYRSGDISKVADDSGIVESVLEVIDQYEETGIVVQPPIVEKFKEINGTGNSEKLGDRLISGVTMLKDSFFKRLYI